MIITPNDVKQFNEQSRVIVENSKRLVPPAQTGPSPLDQRFESARRARQK